MFHQSQNFSFLSVPYSKNLKKSQSKIVQLGTKLNTKIGLNHHHPPPGTFQREGKVLGVPNLVCKH